MPTKTRTTKAARPKKAARKREQRRPAIDKKVDQLEAKAERHAELGQHAEAAVLTEAVAFLRGEEKDDGTS